MRIVKFVLATAAVLSGGLVLADSPQKLSSPADRQFVEKAASGGMAEVKLGKLAMEKGQSQLVKDFGRRMVEDHSKADNQLKGLAANKGMPLPRTVDSESATVYDRLVKLDGKNFDKAYIEAMVKDHDEDVADFKKEANEGVDPDLRAWAQETLPVLMAHDTMARDASKARGDLGKMNMKEMKDSMKH